MGLFGRKVKSESVERYAPPEQEAQVPKVPTVEEVLKTIIANQGVLAQNQHAILAGIQALGARVEELAAQPVVEPVAQVAEELEEVVEPEVVTVTKVQKRKKGG